MTVNYIERNLAQEFPDVAQNLEILAEECAEVIQIKSKISRFGIDDYHPKNEMPNRQALVRELGDVLAMIDVLKANGLFSSEQLEEARILKINKLGKWYKQPGIDAAEACKCSLQT